MQRQVRIRVTVCDVLAHLKVLLRVRLLLVGRIQRLISHRRVTPERRCFSLGRGG